MAHPSAPQFSSSQAVIRACCRPGPSGGMAMRMRTGKRRSAPVISSRGLPGIMFLFCSKTRLQRSRPGVQPLGARSPAPLCFRVMCGRRVYPGRRRSGFVGNIAIRGIAWLLGTGAHAQTDEIQVYDADINTPGQFSLQLHSNYTPIGRRQADFKDGIVPNRTLNGVPEWAYGVTDWLELGAYGPGYSWTGSGRFLIDGAKLRAEFVVPHAQDRSFFYGVNLEFSFNARYWEPTRYSGEIRPIIGGRVGPVDLIVNPILDTSFQGLGWLNSAIQASPASEPDVPDEPMINGIPALTARVIMISVSRLTAAAENMQMPVASGPGPGSVLPASQPIIRAPSEIALSSDSARNPEPSMPVAETSGNDAIATLLDCCCRRRIPPAHAVLYNRAAIPYSRSIAETWSKVRMRAYIFIALSRL